MIHRQKRRLHSVFEEHEAKIKRGPVPIGTICEDLEEMFENGLRKNTLVVMPHPEKKGKFLILKGVSSTGEFLPSTEHMGPANALDPETGDVFAIKIKENKEISLRHIGGYSDVWENILPKMRKLIKNRKK